MTDASSSMTIATRSRLIRAIHYEPGASRLCVLTTHGSLKIHEGVAPDVAEIIAGHEHPGHAYLSMRHELGPKKSVYSLSGYSTALRARRAIRKVVN